MMKVFTSKFIQCMRFLSGIAPDTKRLFLCLLTLASLFSFPASAQRGAYQLPYTRYEADTAQNLSNAQVLEAIQYDQASTAAEASDQKYVQLSGNSSFDEWQVATVGDGVTVRFTMPDSSDGSGTEGALNVYVNGNRVDIHQYGVTRSQVPLTSYWAWQYYPNVEPENQPSTRPRMRFDETHFQLSGVKLQPAQSCSLGIHCADLVTTRPDMGPPGSRAKSFPCMHGVYDHAEPETTSCTLAMYFRVAFRTR